MLQDESTFLPLPLRNFEGSEPERRERKSELGRASRGRARCVADELKHNNKEEEKNTFASVSIVRDCHENKHAREDTMKIGDKKICLLS